MKKNFLMVTPFIGICLLFSISAYAQNGELSPDHIGGKWGYSDKNRNFVIPLIYDYTMEFSDGLAAVKQNKKWGYIDKTGKIVIPLKYDVAHSFSNGIALVKLNEEEFSISKSGDNIGNIIRESILLSKIKEIDKYHSKIHPKQPNKSSAFQISRPYIAFFTGNDTQVAKEKNMAILKYSETDFDENSINNVKTIICAYSYVHDRKTYSVSINGINQRELITKTSCGEIIIYYDVDSKKIIGYDVIKGEYLPNAASSVYNGQVDHYVIKKLIESHLSNSSASSEK